MRPITPWPVFVALVPFLLAGAGARWVLPHLADAIARRVVALAALSASVPRADRIADPSTPEPGARAPSDEPAAPSPPAEAPRAPTSGPVARVAAPSRRRPPSPGRVVIPSDRLLQLPAERLRTVRWTAVRDEHGRGQGVRLSGVGALGVGLVDGDVVTSIGGRPTPTEDAATAAGLAAWGSGAAAVRATILREGSPVEVTLYLPERTLQHR